MRIGLLVALAAGCLTGSAALPGAPEPEKIIFDNDFTGPGGSDLQPVLFLMDNPRFQLLGLTVVTGDGHDSPRF